MRARCQPGRPTLIGARTGELMTFGETELVRRYKTNYGIAPESFVTEQMVLTHWELEKTLRRELLGSNPDNRWDIFATCYSRLYSELDWLNRLTAIDTKAAPSTMYRNWLQLIGEPPQKIYEVGSGKGGLIYYLAQCGFVCRATEITRERGQQWIPTQANLTWGNSDGVHLERFEPANSYDVIVSDQVIEHLHPDDLGLHFSGAARILKERGRYIFSTPHVSVGPADVSRVFQMDKAAGMHLKEYAYREIYHLLKQSGFASVKSVLRLPVKIDRLIGHPLRPRVSSLYLFYLCLLESLLAKVWRPEFRRKAAQVARVVLFAPEIFLVARKCSN